jgi:hypothetical protein
MIGMHPPIALELTTVVLVIVAIVSVVLLVLIIVAPWRQVRNEPPLDKTAEAKLLLRRNPDEPTGEVPRVSAVPTDQADDSLGGDFSDLSNLDELDELDEPMPPAAG